MTAVVPTSNRWGEDTDLAPAAGKSTSSTCNFAAPHPLPPPPLPAQAFHSWAVVVVAAAVYRVYLACRMWRYDDAVRECDGGLNSMVPVTRFVEAFPYM
jgi:hypothetical protein